MRKIKSSSARWTQSNFVIKLPPYKRKKELHPNRAIKAYILGTWADKTGEYKDVKTCLSREIKDLEADRTNTKRDYQEGH